MAKIEGVQRVTKNLSNISKETFDNIVDAAEAVQAKVVNDAKGVLRPGYGYVTGNLQASIQAGDITVTNDNVMATVEANAEYASYVEYGTRRSMAKPFLVPALLNNMATFRKAIKAAVKR